MDNLLDKNIPYSTSTLAKRWGCSRQHISKLVQTGVIKNSFRIGRLIRIPAIEVERVECGNLQNIEANTQQLEQLTAKELDGLFLPRI